MSEQFSQEMCKIFKINWQLQMTVSNLKNANDIYFKRRSRPNRNLSKFQILLILQHSLVQFFSF